MSDADAQRAILRRVKTNARQPLHGASGAAAPSPSARPGTAGRQFRALLQHAEKVELCLFDPNGRRQIELHGAARAHGLRLALLPARCAARPALRLSRARALRARRGPSLQPAQAAARPVRAHDRRASCAGAMRTSATASARGARTCLSIPATARPGMPKCQVIDPAFTWGDDRRPNVPWQDTVIYEMHVKGYTKLPSRGAAAAARHLRRASLPRR